MLPVSTATIENHSTKIVMYGSNVLILSVSGVWTFV